MKQILVLTDFSYDAYNALFYASRLMQGKACTFYILNVYDVNTPLGENKPKIFGSEKHLDHIKKQSLELLTETLHRIVLETGNSEEHEYKTLSKKGGLVQHIHAFLREIEADLIIMGSKGATGAAAIFLGGNTIKVAKKINNCPVLAIPKQIDYRKPKRMGLVTDYKSGCDKETLREFLQLASQYQAHIDLVHIGEEEFLNQEQESRKKMLVLALGALPHTFHRVEDYANKAEVINSFIKKQHIDLFAMVYTKRSLLERLIKEPVIKDVSIYADVPLLILNQPN